MTTEKIADEEISYLLKDRLQQIKNMVAIKYPYAHLPNSGNKIRAEAEAYANALDKLSKEELTAQHSALQEQHIKRLFAQSEARERGLFFNKPDAVVNVDFWGKVPDWKLDEAIAILLGKDPRKVCWTLVQPHTQVSPFAAKYAELRELVSRHAGSGGQLSEPVRSGVFLRWAERYDYTVSPQLKETVEKYGVNLFDWQDAYKQVESALAEMKKHYDLKEKQLDLKEEELQEVMQLLQTTHAELKETLTLNENLIEKNREITSERDILLLKVVELQNQKAQNSDELTLVSELSPLVGKRKGKAPDAFVAALLELISEISKRAQAKKINFEVMAMPGKKNDFLEVAEKFNAVFQMPLSTFDSYLTGLCKFKAGATSSDFYSKLFPEFFKDTTENLSTIKSMGGKLKK